MTDKKNTSSTLPKEVKVEPKTTVEVDKDKLDRMLNRLERLEAAANKAGLSKYDSENKEKKSPKIQLNTLDGKVIVKWDKMITNICEKNQHAVWYEDQKCKIYFEDGTDLEIDYVLLNRRIVKIKATILKSILNQEEEEINNQGSVTYVCRTDDGREYTIGSRFIN